MVFVSKLFKRNELSLARLNIDKAGSNGTACYGEIRSKHRKMVQGRLLCLWVKWHFRS